MDWILQDIPVKLGAKFIWYIMPAFWEMEIKASSASGEDLILMASGFSTCLNKMWFFDVEVMLTCKGIKSMKFKYREWVYKYLPLYICWCTEVLLSHASYILIHSSYILCQLEELWHLRPQQREYSFQFKSSPSVRQSGSPPIKNKNKTWLKMEENYRNLFCNASPLCGNIIKGEI